MVVLGIDIGGSAIKAATVDTATGTGSALFSGGHLVPNTEFGHLTMRNRNAETRAAARVRDERNSAGSAFWNNRGRL